ncbi:uncharacterized protein BDW43DRAFT_291493 [Aspergillus alliaceus]|uniref:uncharacterized protein n=1 Tax=Petromyces alliaceus TaxID=209559 RepID=UPI0012A556C8|nr:uncharacterized protein BDW43DRAFT_291493 [Aspergillus alliaceus]KAB8228338.1 hypothetical protein BDW43DRAFT_291493 [Aspergillus alliaceus]
MESKKKEKSHPEDNLGKWARSSVHKARTSGHCRENSSIFSLFFSFHFLFHLGFLSPANTEGALSECRRSKGDGVWSCLLHGGRHQLAQRSTTRPPFPSCHCTVLCSSSLGGRISECLDLISLIRNWLEWAIHSICQTTN